MFPPQLAATFGEVATFIIKHECLPLNSDAVHIICDAYSNKPTIKDFKRDRKGNADATYSIQRLKPAQQIPIVHFSLRRSSLH